MSKQNIEESVESRVCFEELEDWVREKIQGCRPCFVHPRRPIHGGIFNRNPDHPDLSALLPIFREEFRGAAARNDRR